MIGAWISGFKNTRKPELAHARDERLAVPRIAREPRRLAAFRDELVERRIEGDDDVRRRRIAPLRRPFHVRPLVVQIERERRRIAGALLEHAAPREHEAHPGRAFDAFARRRDQRVEWRRCGRRSPIAANELIASTMRLLPWRATTAAISGSGFRMPGRRLAVDQPDMRDRRIRRRAAGRRPAAWSARLRRFRTSTAGAPSSSSASRAACRRRR